MKQDVWCINRGANGETGPKAHAQPESEQYARLALMCVCIADLPLSLVGDVVTWPYTVAYSFINQPVPTPPVTVAPTEGRPQEFPSSLKDVPRKLP